jgi:hypothetical protein
MVVNTYLFAHIDDLLRNTNPRVIGNWISTRKVVIKISVRNAKRAATTNTRSDSRLVPTF